MLIKYPAIIILCLKSYHQSTGKARVTKVSGEIRTEKRLLSVQIPSKIQSVRIDPGFPVRINGRQRHYPLRQLLFQIVLGLMCPGVPSGGVESQSNDFLPPLWD